MNRAALAAATTVAALLLPTASHATPPLPNLSKALHDICYHVFNQLTGDWERYCIPAPEDH